MERMNLATELTQAETARSEALSQLCALNGGKPIDLGTAEYPTLPDAGAAALYEQAVSSDVRSWRRRHQSRQPNRT